MNNNNGVLIIKKMFAEDENSLKKIRYENMRN